MQKGWKKVELENKSNEMKKNEEDRKILKEEEKKILKMTKIVECKREAT